MSSVTDWNSDVKRYLQFCPDGIPEADRPRVCPHCAETVMLHRHGRFFRCVFTLTERFVIPIFRFRCPRCGKTTSVLPAFLLPKQQAAVDIRKRSSGERLAALHGWPRRSNPPPGPAVRGPYARFGGGAAAGWTCFPSWKTGWRRGFFPGTRRRCCPGGGSLAGLCGLPAGNGLGHRLRRVRFLSG